MLAMAVRLAAFVSACPAGAADNGTAEQQRDCVNDAMTWCSQFIFAPDRNTKIGDCLWQHRTQISRACYARLRPPRKWSASGGLLLQLQSEGAWCTGACRPDGQLALGAGVFNDIRLRNREIDAGKMKQAVQVAGGTAGADGKQAQLLCAATARLIQSTSHRFRLFRLH
jgi:hypothetical protein